MGVGRTEYERTGKGYRRFKDKVEERDNEGLYEPFCKQNQSTKYKVDNVKCFFPTWTSARTKQYQTAFNIH